MGVFGGIFGAAGLPPVEKPGATAELPIERRFGEEVPGEPEVVVEIHPTNPPGLSRFEEKNAAPFAFPSLAAGAPWAQSGLTVGAITFPHPTEGEPIPDEEVVVEVAPSGAQVQEEAPRRVRAERFKPGEEIHVLDIERAELRTKIGEFEGALAALADEVAASSLIFRPVLIMRTLKHKQHAELQLDVARAQLAKKEKRREYLLKVRDGLRQLSNDQENMGANDFDDWGDEPTQAGEE